MATKRAKLPLTPMNRLLRKALKRLREMPLAGRIQLQVDAKLLTQAEADEVKSRLSPEQLASKL